MEEVKWGLRKLEANRDGEMKDLELASEEGKLEADDEGRH